MYDPETGRFTSPDPFKGYLSDPASQNPYMYCRGNPIKYSDPSGYDVYVDPNRDEVTVTYEVTLKEGLKYSDEGVGKLVEEWRQGASDRWSQQGIKTNIVIRVIDAAGNFHAFGEGASNYSGWYKVDLFPGGGQITNNRWFQDSMTANLLGHETGHWLLTNMSAKPFKWKENERGTGGIMSEASHFLQPVYPTPANLLKYRSLMQLQRSSGGSYLSR